MRAASAGLGMAAALFAFSFTVEDRWLSSTNVKRSLAEGSSSAAAGRL